MTDLFSPASVPTLVLLAARVGGLVLVAPVFSTKNVPTMVKTCLIVLLTALLQPVALAQTTVAPEITPATFISESLVGFTLGMGGAILVGAAGVAGDLIGTQIGLSGAAVFDPINSSSENVIGSFASLFAVTLLLAVDAHLVMIDAVAKSVRLVPLGSPLSVTGVHQLIRSAGMLFALGLQFAAPVIATILVANTALAILSRAAPQLNILSVAFPIQICVGLFSLAAAVPFIGAFYHGWSNVYTSTVTQVLDAFAHGAR